MLQGSTIIGMCGQAMPLGELLAPSPLHIKMFVHAVVVFSLCVK